MLAHFMVNSRVLSLLAGTSKYVQPMLTISPQQSRPPKKQILLFAALFKNESYDQQKWITMFRKY